MAIKSIKEFTYIGSKPSGKTAGGVYKTKSSNNNVSVYYLKHAYGIIDEYISSNIANLILDGRAPHVDIVRSHEGLMVASKAIDGFKSLDEITEETGISQILEQKGYIIDQKNKVQPFHKYNEFSSKEIKNIRFPAKKQEDISAIIYFLGHVDTHTSNLGLTIKEDASFFSIIDFDQSLSPKSNYKIHYKSITYRDPYILSSVAEQPKPSDLLVTVKNIVNKESEIYNLLKNLFKDLEEVGLLYQDRKNEIIESISSKLNAFKEELKWLSALEDLRNSNFKPIEEKVNILENSNINLVSDLAVNGIIDLAVEKDIPELLIFPNIANYPSYEIMLLGAKIKFHKMLDGEIKNNYLSTLLCVSVEFQNEDAFNKILSQIIEKNLISKINDDIFENALMSSIKLNEKASFNKILPHIYKQNILLEASLETVNSDRTEMFDEIFPLIKSPNPSANFYKSNRDDSHGDYYLYGKLFFNALRQNKEYYAEKFLSLSTKDTLIFSTKEFLDLNYITCNHPIVFYKAIIYANKTYNPYDMSHFIKMIISEGEPKCFEYLLDMFKNSELELFDVYSKKPLNFIDFFISKLLSLSDAAEKFQILILKDIKFNEEQVKEIFKIGNLKIISIYLSHLVNDAWNDTKEYLNDLLGYQKSETYDIITSDFAISDVNEKLMGEGFSNLDLEL